MADPDDTDTDDPDTEALAEAVVAELDTGTVVDDKIVVSRRGLTALIGAGLGAGALSMLGVDKATAQTAAGQVGTLQKPLDVVAYTISDRNGDSAFISVAASGSVQLSSGSATVTVDSNPPSGSTYSLAIGPTQNAKISGRAFNDGDLKVELVETGTSVGDPTVPYDVIRVR